MNDTLRREIDIAVGEIVRNVTNFPEKVQLRLLGQDMAPLREAIVAKIEERIDGAAHFAAVTAPLSTEERAARPLDDERRRAAIQRVIDYTENGDIGTQRNADALTDELCAALGLPPRRPVVASVEVEFRDVSPEVVSLITGGIPLTDEDRIEAAARSIAGLEPGEEWPTNIGLGGHPHLGTRDDEYRDNIRDTARVALKAAGVIA